MIGDASAPFGGKALSYRGDDGFPGSLSSPKLVKLLMDTGCVDKAIDARRPCRPARSWDSAHGMTVRSGLAAPRGRDCIISALIFSSSACGRLLTYPWNDASHGDLRAPSVEDPEGLFLKTLKSLVNARILYAAKVLNGGFPPSLPTAFGGRRWAGLPEVPAGSFRSRWPWRSSRFLRPSSGASYRHQRFRQSVSWQQTPPSCSTRTATCRPLRRPVLERSERQPHRLPRSALLVFFTQHS